MRLLRYRPKCPKPGCDGSVQAMVKGLAEADYDVAEDGLMYQVSDPVFQTERWSYFCSNDCKLTESEILDS